MKDFGKLATEVHQGKETIAALFDRVMGGAQQDSTPIENKMLEIESHFSIALSHLGEDESEEETALRDYCEMAKGIVLNTRIAHLNHDFDDFTDWMALMGALELAEKATANAFRQAAKSEEAKI